MALPVVKDILECANYTSTVEPYLYQLRPLPQIIWESIASPVGLKQIYLDTNPLISALAFSLALGPIFLVASEINKNYSQVDRFWSILPTVYNAHYAIWAHLAGYNTGRLDLVFLASAIWSTRLTYNYYRKGGYSIGSEDYRWLIVKNYVGQPWFFLFNVTFISFIQSVLLWSITTPAYVLLLASRFDTMSNKMALDSGDVIGFSAMLAFIVISAISDQQQWNYQTAKHEYKKTAKVPAGVDYSQEELDRGFLTSGLFAVSRHPNFAAEQAVWITLHLWSCYATELPFNWTGAGAIAYLALFQGSTWLTELLSTQKYPEYKEYQEQVGMFVPMRGVKRGPIFTNNSKKQIANGATKTAIDAAKDKDAQKARQRYNLR